MNGDGGPDVLLLERVRDRHLHSRPGTRHGPSRAGVTPAPSNAVVPNSGFETGTKDGWNSIDTFRQYDTDEITHTAAGTGCGS